MIVFQTELCVNGIITHVLTGGRYRNLFKIGDEYITNVRYVEDTNRRMNLRIYGIIIEQESHKVC